MADLARTWRLETGSRAVVVPVPLPGRLGRALRAGHLTSPGAWTGRTRFAEWVRARRGAPAASHTVIETAA
jgi:hypothetical protein